MSIASLECSDLQKKQLSQYLDLLAKWNKVYNLTAITNPADMITKHIHDSLSIAPFIQGNTIIDVGTGAGLPGIPLAIWFPEKQFTLLDSNGKKTRFLTQAFFDLGLKNCRAVHARVEKFQPEKPFDCITSRAFADLSKMLTLTKTLGNAKTLWLAMKGDIAESELSIPEGYTADLKKLTVPGLHETRHAVLISKI